MKRRLIKLTENSGKKLLIPVFVMFMLVIGCDSKKNGEGMSAPQGMHIYDLSRYGKPFAIFIPDTVASKLSITEQSSGGLEIKSGKNFAISIYEQAADIELRKKDLKDDEINKLKRFVVSEPAAILWESEITQPEFHFLVNKKTGANEYSFEDIAETDGHFSKEEIERMFHSCKNIKDLK